MKKCTWKLINKSFNRIFQKKKYALKTLHFSNDKDNHLKLRNIPIFLLLVNIFLAAPCKKILS